MNVVMGIFSFLHCAAKFRHRLVIFRAQTRNCSYNIASLTFKQVGLPSVIMKI